MKPKMLIVDDEKAHAAATAESLERVGFDCEIALNAGEGVEKALTGEYGVVFLDLVMPDMSGMEVLEKIKASDKKIEVVMITGKGTVETAVEAMQKGAATYLQKPLNIHELRAVAERLAEKIDARSKGRDVRSDEQEDFSFEGIVGTSPAMQRAFSMIKRVAATDATVLIYGETGTGKDLVAQALHYSGKRRNAQFVPLNCAALSEGIIESELFGHVRGAFTGAVEDRVGRIEYADRGTLFLDEVADMPPSTQVKFLHVLEQGEITPIGSNKSVKVDVRVIAATHGRLHEQVEEGRFREDLYYRLRVVVIDLPPLRERAEDIPLLCDSFLERSAERHGRGSLSLTDEALEALKKYHWPGNVRELKYVIENLTVTAHSSRVDLADLPDYIRTAVSVPAVVPVSSSVPQTMEQAEIAAIKNALVVSRNNREEAARLLGIGERTLYRKIKKYGL